LSGGNEKNYEGLHSEEGGALAGRFEQSSSRIQVSLIADKTGTLDFTSVYD
jgi:hypothetical protein